jgi:hypothetical protein
VRLIVFWLCVLVSKKMTKQKPLGFPWSESISLSPSLLLFGSLRVCYVYKLYKTRDFWCVERGELRWKKRGKNKKKEKFGAFGCVCVWEREREREK